MKHITQIQTRFSDIDAMGHVNNAMYLNYFESARMDFFREVLGEDWDWQKQGILLARNEIDYLQPVFIDERIKVELFCSHIGTKSFTLDYIVSDNKSDEVKTKGRSILVCFNNEEKESIEIPEKIRIVLEKYTID